MKFGIVGPAERAVAWEEHLRPHRAIEEVVISSSLEGIGNVDACLLFDESKNQLKTLLKAIRCGFHSFLISKLPADIQKVEQIYHSAEEANILLQFSHWPTLAPASQWMSKKINKPRFIQIIRQINHTEFMEDRSNIDNIWIDELAFCLKWINGNVHKKDFKIVQLQSNKTHAVHLFLRFDSGATANIYVNTSSRESIHHRFASDKTYLAECDVQSQTVRLGQESEGNHHLFFKKQVFDPAQAAEMAVTQFIKAIQLKKDTLYNGYDLLKLNREVQSIKGEIHHL